MAPISPLDSEQLRRAVDPAQLGFATTAELEDLAETLGQERAVDALHFGVGIRRKGYNVFALGPPGAGKHSTLEQYLHQVAAGEPAPSDWIYVNNFDEPTRPRVLRLPPGHGVRLRDDMDRLIDELRAAIPAALESESFLARRETIAAELKERQEKALAELRERAETQKIALLRTPVGLAFAPMRGDEVIEPQEFAKLPEEEQKQKRLEIEALQGRLQEILRQVPLWEREQRQKLRALRREVTRYSVEHLTDEMEKKWADFPEVLAHLKQVEQSVAGSTQQFLPSERGAPDGSVAVPATGSTVPAVFRRYQVNVLVDHAGTTTAPVIYEDQSTFQNLLGRIEHLPQQGALVTDFLLIRAGALHRANGGYLLVDARKLLTQPFAWELLKRALRAQEVRMEPIPERFGFASTVTLEPEPVPLDVKVILIGDRHLYYLIRGADPEFEDLFKVTAEFDDRMERTEECTRQYARLIATQARRESMRAFDAGAVARVIEEASRVAGDAERLTTRLSALHDLMRESDYWAGERKHDVVSVADVDFTLDAQQRRAGLIRERIREEIRRGTIHVETTGARVGQVNALAIHEFGGYSFGRPTRITAKVRLGRGEVIDIEREVALGGPLHAKGVLILSGYLGSRYHPNELLSLSATLVFEQSYGGVDGDSASSAELYALLSALSEAPIRQSLAITGSVDQNGNVQAIGGVNEKIEGFFDVCREAGGLTGDQGVMIPATNVKHLMLRRDVVAACAEGRFHVYAVETIDQGIELLTGIPAGEQRSDGTFPEGTLNRRVADRLRAFVEAARRYLGASRILAGPSEALDVVRTSGLDGPTVPGVPDVPKPPAPPIPPLPPIPVPDPPAPPAPADPARADAVSEPAVAIRRLLVALEAGAEVPPDVEAIVALAKRLHAEILGLVIEDVNLLRSASLPFVHQVSLLTGAAEPFEVEWVEQAMHRSAVDVEQRLGRAAAARDVIWTLRVVRGSVVDQVLAAVQEGDLLVFEAQPAPRYVASATADPAAAVARRSRRPVLIVQPGARLVGRPMLVVFDGTEDSVTALRFAVQIAGDGNAVVEVALLASDHDQRVALEAAAREALLGFTGIVRLHRLTDADPRRACALAHRLGSAILFVGAESALLRERGLAQVLDELRCPVWVVR